MSLLQAKTEAFIVNYVPFGCKKNLEEIKFPVSPHASAQRIYGKPSFRVYCLLCVFSEKTRLSYVTKMLCCKIDRRERERELECARECKRVCVCACVVCD